MEKINTKDFTSKSIEEQNLILANNYNNLAEKFEKIEKLNKTIEESYNKIKPLLEKIPTTAIKEKASSLFGKFKK